MYRASILFLFVLLSVTTMAQDKKQQDVADAVEELRSAMINADRSKLEKLTSPELSYGHSSGVIDDQKEFVDKIISARSDFVTITLKDQTITVSGKTAIVRHQLDATTNDGGKPGEVHLKILLVWQKQDKKWKLLARQAVRI